MAPSYRVVAHTYNTIKNKQNFNQLDSLPPSQPSLLQAPKPITKAPNDYNLVEQL